MTNITPRSDERWEGGFVRDTTTGELTVKVTQGSVALSTSDIEVGAVEIKNATTDDRVTVSAAGALKVDASSVAVPVTGPLTDTQLRLTPVPVSGTVTASGPLTDTQLRNSAVPVSGTVTASGPVTDAQIRATPLPVSGTVTVTDGSGSLTVDGTVAVSNSFALDATLTGGTQKSKLVDTGGTNVASVSAAGALKVDASGVAVPVTDNAGSLTVDAPVGAPVFVRLSDGAAAQGSSTAPIYTSGRNGTMKNLCMSGNIGITTAATWMDQVVWAVPSASVFKPKLLRCAVTTAGSRSMILAGRQLGTFNPGTNTFAATGSVASPDFYDRLMYRVASVHSATATTITATYTDQDGASSTSVGTVIPASAAAKSWFEVPLAAGDFGVRSVTAIADTAAPTSVVDEIWGFRTLLEDLGPALTPQVGDLGDSVGVPNGESVVILFNAAATTAQQRFACVLGDIIAV